MGRIGRLVLRAAMGGVWRAPEDPRAGNRLEIVHVNELKGGAAATAHLLEFDSLHGRWRECFGVEDDRTIHIGTRRIGFSDAATVFVNGEPIASVDASYSYDRPRQEGLIGADQLVTYVPLRAGVNVALPFAT
jgi:hypothetical protein